MISSTLLLICITLLETCSFSGAEKDDQNVYRIDVNYENLENPIENNITSGWTSSTRRNEQRLFDISVPRDYDISSSIGLVKILINDELLLFDRQSSDVNITIDNNFWHGEKINLGKNLVNEESSPTTTLNFIKQKGLDGENLFFGSIIDEENNLIYRISPDEFGELQVKTTHVDEFLEELDVIDGIIGETDDGSLIEEDENLDGDDDGEIIDILILWTKHSECRNSGLERGCILTERTKINMLGLVKLAIAETNTAFSFSGIKTQLRLVFAYRHESFEESYDMRDTLINLARMNGDELDDVHEKRNKFGADMVSLFVDGAYACGIAFIGPWKSQMFSVIDWSCSTGHLSFAHEVGHNLGCRHDRGTFGDCTNSNFNFGYRDPQARFRSIMAYDCRENQCDNIQGNSCTRVQRFSNDQYNYSNVPIGNAMNDCSRQINQVRRTVARYHNSLTDEQINEIIEEEFGTSFTKHSRSRRSRIRSSEAS